MNRSNLNSHLGEGDPFWCWGQQPARECHLCETSGTKRCCWSPAAWPPLHSSCFAYPSLLLQSALWESSTSQGCRPPLFLIGDGALHDLTSTESLMKEDSSLMTFGMDFNSFWDLARDRGPYYLHLYPTLRLSCLTKSIQFFKSGKFKELETHYWLFELLAEWEIHWENLRGTHLTWRFTYGATLVPGRLIWDAAYLMPEFCLVSQRSQKSHSCSSPAGYLSVLELTISLLCY